MGVIFIGIIGIVSSIFIYLFGFVIVIIEGQVSSAFYLIPAIILTLSIMLIKLRSHTHFIWFFSSLLALIIGLGSFIVVYLLYLPVIYFIPGFFLALAGSISLRLLRLRFGLIF